MIEQNKFCGITLFETQANNFNLEAKNATN
jgi:hypothetical protein